MLQLLTVLPCSRALKGPNGFHLKAASFLRQVQDDSARDICFLVCLGIKNESPPEVQIKLLNPFINRVYTGETIDEDEPHAFLTQLVVRVRDVVINETGEYPFLVVVNGTQVLGGSMWATRGRS